jgi:hypothetical protein
VRAVGDVGGMEDAHPHHRPPGLSPLSRARGRPWG